jgi:hypothetical protein
VVTKTGRPTVLNSSKHSKAQGNCPSILRLVFCLDNLIPLGVSTETAFKTCSLKSGCSPLFHTAIIGFR